MTSEQRRALVIAHEADGGGGQVTVRLKQRGYDVHDHLVVPDHERPRETNPFPDIEDYDLIAIMGSVRSLTRLHEIDAWIDDELDLVRKAHAADQPVLGICFGGQVISEALGGSVESSPVTEIGWFEIDPMDGADNPVGSGPWFEWHHDRFDPPPGASVLATTDSAPQLFTIGRTAGTQFHPEVDRHHLSEWLSGAPGEYLDAYDVDADALIALTAAHEAEAVDRCHSFVDWFLDRSGLD